MSDLQNNVFVSWRSHLHYNIGLNVCSTKTESTRISTLEKPLPEMKTILRKTQLIAVVWLFLLFQFISAEEFTIDRWKSMDSFTIPQSKCNRNLDNCKPYFALNAGDPCRCYCTGARATFAFSKNSWACLKNNATRSSFGKGFFKFTEKMHRFSSSKGHRIGQHWTRFTSTKIAYKLSLVSLFCSSFLADNENLKTNQLLLIKLRSSAIIITAT